MPLADSLEVDSLCPASSDHKNSCGVLASPETPEDSEESTDVVMSSHSEVLETTVPIPIKTPSIKNSTPITRPDVNIDDGKLIFKIYVIET